MVSPSKPSLPGSYSPSVTQLVTQPAESFTQHTQSVSQHTQSVTQFSQTSLQGFSQTKPSAMLEKNGGTGYQHSRSSSSLYEDGAVLAGKVGSSGISSKPEKHPYPGLGIHSPKPDAELQVKKKLGKETFNQRQPLKI